MSPTDAIALLRSRFATGIGAAATFRDEHAVEIAPDAIASVCAFLKRECGFDMLTDLSGIDHHGSEPRFEVQYLLYAMAHRTRLRLKVFLPESNPALDSVTAVWRTANWHEREAFDMFGIRFHGHPNLKRILMWEGYPHHPLRKDFPLAGLPAELPDTADGAGRVDAAPMAGGPFVPGTGTNSSLAREPRQYDTASEQIDKAGHPHKQEAV